MCRLAAYIWETILLEDIIIKPKHSIIDQSKHSTQREDPLNGDGFWIAWYKSDIQSKPAVFKEITPAWNNKNLKSLCSVTSTQACLIHIRDATGETPVIFPNCHPFIYQDISLVHNGHIPQFSKIKRSIINMLDEKFFLLIQWNTDSEHFFVLFLQNYFNNPQNNIQNVAIALKKTIHDIEVLLKKYNIINDLMLNIVISNWEYLIGSRFHSKWILGINSLYYKKESQNILLSSEPLDDNNLWEEIPENTIIIANKNKKISFMQIL
jgi:predicted glutamine amidotransferase